MTWLSTFFSATYCEKATPSEGSSASHNKDDASGSANDEKQEEASTKSDEGAEKEEGEDAPAEEEEEEEPEDILPGLREDCKEGKACFQYNTHFEHCQEKVNAGKGHKGEDCVEELFHLMHCVDNCVAPKLFSKLK